MLPGRVLPGVFPPEVRATVTAHACSLPASPPPVVATPSAAAPPAGPPAAVPLARWSCAELVAAVAARCDPAGPSPATIRRWLVAERLRPWRYHSWQHIHDPPAFLARARPVLTYYENAADLWHTGTWVICVDEKTSIQAREPESAPQPAVPRHVMHTDPRYIRHGAVQLFGALSVADGLVYGQCRERKCFADFQGFLTEVVLPEAARRKIHTLVLILDNGPTHAPKQMEAWLAEQAAARQLKIQVAWLPVRASWLDQIEIWFSILQRKRLQPNHFGSRTELEAGILDFIRHYNDTAKPINWTYTVEKLEKKLLPQPGADL